MPDMVDGQIICEDCAAAQGPSGTYGPINRNVGHVCAGTASNGHFYLGSV